ncbi:NAD dependent epimerase/dehydratase [Terfezia boudieri ATCC MYA-4762]|uniref:NAD dependent epimerase/dehydratase n=1 Tax=Terfezia boudieri ATCC MYA-4762 TaxID=1051890 RepID=A0A3N4M018_9PEZI|nr:NAD dependent epimerase/dehydratase [Terfezia boudieri ATCC MYA-4762]
MSNPASKPSVLIIGGLGFIGRYLAKYIYDNDLASEIKIVDKQLPQLAWLAPEFETACSMERFQQADMSREQTCEKVFSRPDGSTWDYVFNCGGDTRYCQQDEIYKQRSLKLSVVAGKEAAKRGVKFFVELSTGAIYKPESTPTKETAKIKPWLKLAKYKLQAENELQKIPGLNLVIVRMANVYGEYCSKLVGTMLCMARVYKELDREMKWLWTKDLKSNTVHVKDVARALWHVSQWYVNGKENWDERSMGETPVFNIVDEGDTDQGILSEFMASIFQIKTGFHGTLVSQIARLNLGSAVDEENDELLQPWGDLLNQYNITRPGPITPYLEGDTIKDCDFCLDGSRFREITKFEYSVPKVTEECLREIIDSYGRMNWWPPMDGAPKAAQIEQATT